MAVVLFRPPSSLQPQAPKLEDLITRTRLLARATGAIRWDNPHVRQKMALRSLHMSQVLDTIRNGSGSAPAKMDSYGDWRFKLVRKVAGRRVQIVLVVKEDHIVVVTVI